MPRRLPASRREHLRSVLDGFYDEFHRPEFLGSDPLEIVHRYPDDSDREVVALIAASFAFGGVPVIRRAIQTILAPLGPHPATALARGFGRRWPESYVGFRYRWIDEADLQLYLEWIGAALRREGSLGALWRRVDDPAETHILGTLSRWIAAIADDSVQIPGLRQRTLVRSTGEVSPLPPGARLLLTSPAGKSGCKRMNLFLRWVCRPADGIDLGLWDVAPRRLIMPVDTHVLQAAHRLGLTKRTAADLKTAQEITGRLGEIAPEDPCRYDFSMTRPGIMRRLLDP